MSYFTPQTIAKCVASCDERIDSIKDKLSSWRVYGKVLNLVDLDMETKYQDKIKNYENNIKLIQTEKLLYNALANPSSKSAIFPKLLTKYDELMGASYDLSGNMVITGVYPEGDYLEYCSQSLAQREYIRKLCYVGEMERKGK
jgi:hypothetical protein